MKKVMMTFAILFAWSGAYGFGLSSQALEDIACEEVLYDHFDYDSDMGYSYCGDMRIVEITADSTLLVMVELFEEQKVCAVELRSTPLGYRWEAVFGRTECFQL